jgi:TM2 domain-containing membrane protein YozV
MSQALACPHCGKNYVISERYSGAAVKCQFCGERFRVPEEELIPDAVFVDEDPAPAAQSRSSSSPEHAHQQSYVAPPNHRMGVIPHRTLAAFLAIFLGTLGIHHFYTGQTSKGIYCLIWTVFTCGLAMIALAVIGLIDGIRYLTMNDQEWSHRWENYAL